LNEVARLYPVKNITTLGQHLSEYRMPRPAVQARAEGGVLVAYHPEEEKKKRTFINMAIAHAKAVPGPQKYSRILKWESEDKRRSALPRSDRVSIFAEAAKAAKGVPGPGSYSGHRSKDSACLRRTLGTYTSHVDKVSVTTCEAHAKKGIPGPQHKYQVSHGLVEERTPFYATLSTCIGRDNKPAV